MFAVLERQHSKDPITRAIKTQHFGAVFKSHPGFFTFLSQSLGKLSGIAAFVIGGVSRAGNTMTDRFKGRLQLNRTTSIDNLTVTAQITHDAGRFQSRIEFGRVGVEMQNALG